MHFLAKKAPQLEATRWRLCYLLSGHHSHFRQLVRDTDDDSVDVKNSTTAPYLQVRISTRLQRPAVTHERVTQGRSWRNSLSPNVEQVVLAFFMAGWRGRFFQRRRGWVRTPLQGGAQLAQVEGGRLSTGGRVVGRLRTNVQRSRFHTVYVLGMLRKSWTTESSKGWRG